MGWLGSALLRPVDDVDGADAVAGLPASPSLSGLDWLRRWGPGTLGRMGKRRALWRGLSVLAALAAVLFRSLGCGPVMAGSMRRTARRCPAASSRFAGLAGTPFTRTAEPRPRSGTFAWCLKIAGARRSA